jgi:hypothetical protein
MHITGFAKANGIVHPMGLIGISWNNVMAESAFATLKTKFYYRRVWPMWARAVRESVAWIEDRYNCGGATLRTVVAPRWGLERKYSIMVLAGLVTGWQAGSTTCGDVTLEYSGRPFCRALELTCPSARGCWSRPATVT